MISMVIQAINRGRRKNSSKGAIHEGADRLMDPEPGQRQIANQEGFGILLPEAWQGVSAVYVWFCTQMSTTSES
jgi:hypothetical protein